MCEANVYFHRGGKEELFMEKVARIVPGEEDNLFLESIFGERRVVKARIREMELVRHRIILDDISEDVVSKEYEIWLDLDTNHGHFHEGEEVRLKLFKGYNMLPDKDSTFCNAKAFLLENGEQKEIPINDENHGEAQLVLGQEVTGLIPVFVQESNEKELYSKLLLEVGHHHHHGVKPIGLPLEIVPCSLGHARMGENYEIQVLRQGKAVSGIEVKATYSGTHNKNYPYKLTTNEEGKTSLFLTARGNFLFSVSTDNIISTFTLVKSF
jgi:predicted RNA-binding protein